MWFWRNEQYFDPDFSFPAKPLEVIFNYVCDIDAARKLAQTQEANHLSCMVNIGWQCSEDGWVQLNTDGSMNFALSKAGCGGLIRNSRGEWVVGFTKNLGSCDAFVAEVWGVLEGLNLAWNVGV